MSKHDFYLFFFKYKFSNKDKRATKSAGICIHIPKWKPSDKLKYIGG